MFNMRWLIFIGLMLATRGDAQFPTIGVIDFYGLGEISERQARESLQIKEGDSLSDEPIEARRRLESLPNVEEARFELVCCAANKAILYVGIRKKGEASIEFRATPKGTVRLPQYVMQAGESYQ